MTLPEEEDLDTKNILDEIPLLYYSIEESRSEPISRPRDRKQWIVVIALMYANFWMSASLSLQAPFFPREAEMKGATPTEYGFVFGMFELVCIIMCPVYGKLIPRISPKFILTAGVLVLGSSCCIFGLLDNIEAGKMYITMCFVVRIFEGFGAAALMTASFTILAALFPDTLATTFSLTETAYGFGFIAGPTIGGALYQVGGFVLPFVVSGGFLLLGSFLLLILLPSIVDTTIPDGSRNLLKFLADGSIIVFALTILSSTITMGFNAATLEPHLRDFNLAPVVLGSIFIIGGGIYAITTPIFGRIIDKGADPIYIAGVGYIFSCTGILLVGPAPFIPFETTVWTVIGSLVIIGFGLASKLVSSFVGALKNSTERGLPDNLATYGMVSALISTACSIGAFIGPSLGGILLDTTGYIDGTLIMFAFDLFFFIILISQIIIKRMKKKKTMNEQTENDPVLNSSVVP